MSQNDFTIANQGFPAFRADLNSALQALATNNSGTSAPSTTFANMWWYDSTNNIMYIRNEDNDAWIKFAELDQTNDKFVLSGTLQLDDGSASAPALTFNSDTNMGIYRGGTDILRFVTAGADRLQIAADGSISTPTSGTSNFRAGVNAGNALASGSFYNILVGDQAGEAITVGDYNIAIGHQALEAMTGGQSNIAIGYQALQTANVASGQQDNTAVGYLAGTSVTTGVQNTIIGSLAGDALTDADRNVAVGRLALSTDTLGSRSTAIGWNALATQNFTSATDTNNTAVGYSAGSEITTGIQNTLMGGQAGDALTDADYNVAIGYQALSTDTKGNYSVAIGLGALLNQNFTSSTDTGNVAIGRGAGNQITTGTSNTFIGSQAGDALTDADSNVALGTNSLAADTLGSKSIAIGQGALFTQNFTSATDSHNVAVGHEAGVSVTTGTNNTIVGSLAGASLTTGTDNIFIGKNSASNCTQAGGNVIIGDSDGQSSVVNHQIIIGNSVVGVGQDNFTFGRASLDSNIAFGATSISAPSDERLKEDIKDETIGLAFINELRPVTFQWKKEKDIPSDMKEYVADSETRVMNGKYNHGFIAQEVKSVIDKHDIKDGLGLWLESGEDKRQRLAEGELIPFLVKAIQELSAEVTALKGE